MFIYKARHDTIIAAKNCRTLHVQLKTNYVMKTRACSKICTTDTTQNHALVPEIPPITHLSPAVQLSPTNYSSNDSTSHKLLRRQNFIVKNANLFIKFGLATKDSFSSQLHPSECLAVKYTVSTQKVMCIEGLQCKLTIMPQC